MGLTGYCGLMNKEELSTEDKQINDNNITMDVICRALPRLKPEFQDVILANYKLTEIQRLLNNYSELDKYLHNILDGVMVYVKIVNAFIVLYNEALVETRDKKGGIVEVIGRLYDGLPDESKQKVCQDLLDKRTFFEDAYGMIMDSFNNALEVEGDVAGG